MSFFKPQFMQPWIDAYKKGGIKELLSQHGWKVIIGFFFLQGSTNCEKIVKCITHSSNIDTEG